MLRVAAGVLVAFIAMAAASSSVSAPTAAIARFREVERAHSALGSFGGATETWRTAVMLSRRPQTIGTGYVACIKIARSFPARQCVGVYRLPEGSIHLSGTVHTRATFSLLITATSGAYEGLHGSVSFVRIAEGPRQSLITFYFVD